MITLLCGAHGKHTLRILLDNATLYALIHSNRKQKQNIYDFQRILENTISLHVNAESVGLDIQFVKYLFICLRLCFLLVLFRLQT